MTQTPGDKFALWLEHHTLDNEGYQHNPAIVKKVNELIQREKAPLLKLLKGREYD